MNWYKTAFINNQKNIYAFNVTSTPIDMKKLIKLAQQEVALTPQQQQYIELIADDVYEYIKNAIRERIEKQHINPDFIGDFATMEDMAQEGIIKAMEIVNEYWEPGDMPNLHSLWSAIKVSLRKMITRLTQSIQPSTAEDEWSRQYTDREPIYHNPLFDVANFLDEKIKEHFGERALVYSDSQTIGEYIDYLTDKYRDEIIKMSKSHFDENITRDPDIPYQKQLENFVDGKVIKRYKNRRQLERGGRTQFEYGDTEGLQDDKLLSIMNLQNLPDETPEEQSQREILADFIKRTIVSIPNLGVKLAAVLFFGLDMEYFGFNFNQEQLRNVLEEANKGFSDPDIEITPNWSGIKRLLPTLVTLLGGDKQDVQEAEKIANMNTKKFQQELENYIQLAYRDYYSNPENLPSQK